MSAQKSTQACVFVVEDDGALRDSLSYMLEAEGYEVHAFGDGEALLLQDFPSRDACIVLDQNLPGLSGTETLFKLRARNIALPALIVTTHPKGPLHRAALAGGARVGEKPLIGEEFLARIGAALEATGRI